MHTRPAYVITYRGGEYLGCLPAAPQHVEYENFLRDPFVLWHSNEIPLQLRGTRRAVLAIGARGDLRQQFVSSG